MDANRQDDGQRAHTTDPISTGPSAIVPLQEMSREAITLAVESEAPVVQDQLNAVSGSAPQEADLSLRPVVHDAVNGSAVSEAREANEDNVPKVAVKENTETQPPSVSASASAAAPARASPIPGGLSSATTEILARISAASPAADYSVAREHILKSIVTSDNLPSLPPPAVNGRGRGRPKTAPNDISANDASFGGLEIKVESEATPLTSIGGKSLPAASAGQASARGGKRKSEGRAAGKGKKNRKRKRTNSERSSLTDSSDDEGLKHEHGANGMSEPKVTKSGRAVHRPTQFVPVPTQSPGGSSKPQSAAPKKRKRMRRNPENAVCKSCERGHSPDNNAIVFCDGCGTPYHQYCHTPPIDKEYIEIAEKEWLCIDCGEQPVELPADFSRLIPGDNLSIQQKRATFAQLTHAELIDVLVHATSLQPSLAIFPPPITALNGVYDHLEPGSELPYDGYETDPPAHYPKPGHGLGRTLPPESEHLDWLLDDNAEVFSHVVNDKPYHTGVLTNGGRH